MNKLEQICNEQSSCKNCPLLIKKMVSGDDTYDYHTTYLCYLKESKRIKEIEAFIHETFRQEIENKVMDFVKNGLPKEEVVEIINKLIKENEESL